MSTVDSTEAGAGSGAINATSSTSLPLAAAGEEGIMVAIRMRPLNSRESSATSPSENNSTNDKSSNPHNHRVWRVLQKYNSVAQCTAAGKPLPERIVNRNFFTFDKTFGETSTTRQVYNDVAKGIVQSVCDGLNGTIFAYGQTSSGKTFTMQGCGSLDVPSNQNSGGGGGIVHMAASDIFNHIDKDSQRVFLIRVSFIEIYNEEVRDLLVTSGSSGDNNNNTTHPPLTIREDKQRGVFVNSNETIVTSIDGLLGVLFAGEKNRHVGSTAMNERSSRSHTIFRITVESRRLNDGSNSNDVKEEEEEEEEYSDGDDDDARMGGCGGAARDGSVRVSTLNLVDLAGSESVRHTGATGDRQKEGVKINLSLLTLSRVISNLGQGAAHVNFRDSKLTRILQPSLSGNARMAVICCATPSDLYLEETRSTLQFASRAKLVKTRAQVNEVMDDRSLIKKLQRELKEARRGGPGKEAIEQMKALEEKAASAVDANRKAEQDLKRMKELLLKGGVLNVGGKTLSIVYNGDNGTFTSVKGDHSLNSTERVKSSKRRYSDGIINDNENGDPQLLSSPSHGGNVSQKHARTEMKVKKTKSTAHNMSKDKADDVNVTLLREALAAKSSQAAELKIKLQQVQQEVEAAKKKLEYECGEKEIIRLAKHDLESQVSILASDKDFALHEQDIIITEKDKIIATSMEKIERLIIERNEQDLALSESQAQSKSLQSRLSGMKMEHEDQVRQLNDEQRSKKEEIYSKILAMEGTLEMANTEKSRLAKEVDELNGSLSTAISEKNMMKAEFDEKTKTMNCHLERTTKEKDQRVAELSHEVSKLTEERDRLQSTIEEKENEIIKFEESAKALNSDLNAKNSNIESLESIKSDLEEKMRTLQVSTEGLISTLGEKETALGNAESLIALLRKETTFSTAKTGELMKLIDDMQKEKEALEARLGSTDAAMIALESETAAKLFQAEAKAEELNDSIFQLEEEKKSLEASFASLQQNLSCELEAKEALQLEVQSKVAALDDVSSHYKEAVSTIEGLTEEKNGLEARTCALETEVSSLKAEVASLGVSLEAEQLKGKEMESQLEVAKNKVVEIVEEKNVSDKSNQDLEAALSEMAETKKAMETSILDLATKLDSVSKERNIAESRVSELISGNGNMEQIMQVVRSEKSKLAFELEEANEKLRTVEESKDELISKVEAAIAEKDKISGEMSKMEIDQRAKLSKMAEGMEHCKGRIIALTIDLDTCKSACDDVMSQMEDVKIERDTLQSRVDELLSGSTCAQEVLAALGAEKEAISSHLEEVTSHLKDKENEISSLARKIENLVNDISVLKSEKSDVMSQLKEATANYKALEIAHKESSETLTSVIAEKETLMSVAIDSESKYNEKISELNSSLVERSNEISQLRERIAELKEEAIKSANQGSVEDIQELKSLLASANKSVNEARSSAALADKELEKKELELEETFRKLEEQEEARRIAEAKVALAEQSPRTSAKCDSEEALLKEMEILMGEKIEAESLLESELKKRKEFEEGVKRCAEEEKQILVDEAEEKMVSLRDKIMQLQSDLSRAESEGYNMKDENADLRDRVERAEAKVMDTESIITSMTAELRREQEQKTALVNEVLQLKEESEVFKSQVFAAKESFEAQARAKVVVLEENLSDAISRLSVSKEELKQAKEMISNLTSDIQEYKNELESTKKIAICEKEIEISMLREKLATAKLSMQTSEAEFLSTKRELNDLKEKVEKIKNHEHAKRQELASKAEATINALKIRLETATAMNTRFEKTGGGDDRREVDALKARIQEKEARIEKLEKAKITRAQIEQITKLKDERSQFKAEAENYKQRLAELGNDSSSSTRRGLREKKASDHDQSREIAMLQDDLQQCEDKLRKYVQHSERLESERKSVMDAVASYNICDAVSGSVAETVASICERLASVEEECNALAQSEKKAMQYLGELDSLRERFAQLESKLQCCIEEKVKLNSQLEESRDSLNKSQGKIAELVKDRNSLQDLADSAKRIVSELQSEKRRQMQFLENENLQLGDELKRVKKEMQQIRAVFNAPKQQQALDGEETQELVGFSSLRSGQALSDLKPPLQPTKTIFGTPSKSDRKRPDFESINNEENTLNYTPNKKLKSSTSKSPFRSSLKAKNPFSSIKNSAKKKSMKKKFSDDSPTKSCALGDNGSETTTDLTSECKQS